MDAVIHNLQVLINNYGFSLDTMSRYLGLTKDQVKELSEGNKDVLPEETSYRFKMLNKISFLYSTAKDDKDFKLNAFLDVLVSYHGMSEKTIAKVAGVEEKDVKDFLSCTSDVSDDKIKYKIAVTVMALRFFLKECEPV